MDKLVVRGTEINVQWDLKRDDFLSLTDIAKIKDSDKPDSHHPNISPVISGYKQPSKSAQSIEITGFIEKSKPPEIIFFYTLLPLTA